MARVGLVECIADVSHCSVLGLAGLIKKQGKCSLILMASGVFARSAGNEGDTGFASSENHKPWCRFYRFTLKLRQAAAKPF